MTKLASRFLAVALALTASASFAVAAPSNWTIDQAHTEVGFSVKHMFSNARGVFRDVEGTVVFDDANASNIKVDASVKVASVDTGNEKRDGHLKSADFFDAEKYPTIAFKSTKVTKAGKNKYKVTGDFTMHGVTKVVTFDGEFLGAGDMAMGGKNNGTKAGFSATTVINRKDFGMTYNAVLDNGGIMLGEDVKIELNIEVNLAK